MGAIADAEIETMIDPDLLAGSFVAVELGIVRSELGYYISACIRRY